MNKYQIACVIVTYNRKNLLKNCLDAVASQTFKPHTVYITDNASTDGTLESVKEWGYYECERDEIRYKYVLNTKNEGGAGGFYLGMKTAYEEGIYDGLWVMDDDGIPDKNCLINLISYLGTYHFLSPLVVAKENNNRCAFYECSIATFKQNAKQGVLNGYANPFNGVLFSVELIKIIGFPMKEMFIWGDEHNYMVRAIVAGFQLVTVVDAIHEHPMDRQHVRRTIWNESIVVSDSKWKLYCYIRNKTYNICHVGNVSTLKKLLRMFRICVQYVYYYTIMEKKPIKGMIINAVWSGYRKDFSGLQKYM